MYDIIPPKMAHKVENAIKSLEGNHKNTNLPKKPVRRQVKNSYKNPLPPETKKSFPFKWLALFGAGVLVVFCGYAFIKLPKADVEIWPKMDTLTLQDKMTIDVSKDTLDIPHKIIPAQFIEVQESATQEFPATGSAANDGKATGTLRIYNKMNSVFTLIKGTHFLSDSGKYFITLKKVAIPAAQKNTPGSIVVDIQAEQSGSDYNIGPSKFSVPKLYGTSYYYSIYGESAATMAGGYTGTVKKVTQDDIKTAQEIMTKKISIQAKDSLKTKIGPDDILLDGAITTGVISASSDVKVDAIANTFKETAEVTASALVFKKQDVENFIKDEISNQLPSGNTFLQTSLSSSYSPGIPDMKKRVLVVNLQSSVMTYKNINVDDLAGLFSSKSADQIKQVVDQMYADGISELKVNFWPFWVKKAPKDKNRIYVQLHLQ